MTSPSPREGEEPEAIFQNLLQDLIADRLGAAHTTACSADRVVCRTTDTALISALTINHAAMSATDTQRTPQRNGGGGREAPELPRRKLHRRVLKEVMSRLLKWQTARAMRQKRRLARKG